MQKAKSRLQKKVSSRASSRTKKLPFGRYRHYLPLLVISLPFYAGVYYLFTHVYPKQIKNFLIPNTYLPLQLLLWGGNFFLLSYLLLDTRLGFFISLLISVYIFLKLQQITNFIPVFLLFGLILLIFEVLFRLKRQT